mgnify:CR=1 FL=1
MENYYGRREFFSRGRGSAPDPSLTEGECYLKALGATPPVPR